MESGIVSCRDRSKEPVGEVATEDRPDLGDFARFAQPVEARGERLLQCQRDRLCAFAIPALQEQAGHFLDEQRHAASPLAYALDNVFGKRVTRGELTDHVINLSAFKRSERKGAMMRAHAPRRTK